MAPPGLEPATHPKVRRAILLMEQHVGQPLSLPEMAHRLDVSVRQLERLFTTETGKSPGACARHIRIRMASWLLTSSDRTVADIASSCGFSDASHLGRAFRKEFGASPNECRSTRLPNAHEVPGGTTEPDMPPPDEYVDLPVAQLRSEPKRLR